MFMRQVRASVSRLDDDDAVGGGGVLLLLIRVYYWANTLKFIFALLNA